MVKKPDRRVLVVAILVLLAGAAVLFFNLVPLPFEVPFLPDPSLENTTEGSGNYSVPTTDRKPGDCSSGTSGYGLPDFSKNCALFLLY